MKALHCRYRNNRTRSGSVLVIILVAIALFAALSYAMMRDGGSGTATRTMTDTQARLAATEIIAYADLLARTVQRLRINGCVDTELDFANDDWKNHSGLIYYPARHNPNAPTDGRCSVFGKAGGLRPFIVPASSIYYLSIERMAPTSVAAGSSVIRTGGIPGIGTSDREDLSFVVPWLDLKICMTINDMVGVENVNGRPPLSRILDQHYHGEYPAETEFLNDIEGKVAGKRSFCTINNHNPVTQGHQTRFVRVLIAR